DLHVAFNASGLYGSLASLEISERDRNDSPQARGSAKNLRMHCSRKRVQSLNQRAGRRVQELIIDAIDAAVACGLGSFPAATSDDLFERHAIAGATPGRDDDVRICIRNFFFAHLLAGIAEEASAGYIDQLRHPALRQDQRFAPLFAIDEWP